MPRITVSTVVKLLIASLVVGLLLAWFNVSPQDLVRSMIGEAGSWKPSCQGLATPSARTSPASAGKRIRLRRL